MLGVDHDPLSRTECLCPQIDQRGIEVADGSGLPLGDVDGNAFTDMIEFLRPMGQNGQIAISGVEDAKLIRSTDSGEIADERTNFRRPCRQCHVIEINLPGQHVFVMEIRSRRLPRQQDKGVEIDGHVSLIHSWEIGLIGDDVIEDRLGHHDTFDDTAGKIGTRQVGTGEVDTSQIRPCQTKSPE